MREAIRMVVTLGGLCIAVGLILAGVYGQTAPIIAAQEAQAVNDGLARVLPGAASFDPVPAEELSGAGEAVKSAWRARNAAGQQVGVVVESAPSGYGGPIRMLVGVTAEGRVQQMTILSASGETPGLGLRTTEPAFMDQFAGRKAGIGLVKGKAPNGNEIQVVTGATISSQAVLGGVNQALDAARQLQEAR